MTYIERDIEDSLKTKIEKSGGICLKFVSPSTRGVPDRIVIYKGVTAFVEVKRPLGMPRPLQEAWHRKLKGHGALVSVLSTFEEVDNFVRRIKSLGDRNESETT